MSSDNGKTEISRLEWIPGITDVLTLFVALVAFINTVEEFALDRRGSRILSIAAFVIYFVGTLQVAVWRRRNEKKWWWLTLVALYIVTVPYFVWVGSWMQWPEPRVDTFPFVESARYSFEEQSTTAVLDAWKAVTYKGAQADLKVTEDESFTRSGGRALELQVIRLGPNQAVRIVSDPVHAGVDAASAWLFIPESPHTGATRLRFYVVACGESFDGERICFRGHVVNAVPGKWTYAAVGLGRRVEVDRDGTEWPQTVTRIEVIVYGSYMGPVYVDDIVLFTQR